MPGPSRFLGPRGRRRRSGSSGRLRETPGKATGQAAAEPHHAAPRPTLPQSRRRRLRPSPAAPPARARLPLHSRPRRGPLARPRSHSPGAAHARCSRPARGDPGPALLSRRRPRGAGRGGVRSASAARDRAAGWAGRGRRGTRRTSPRRLPPGPAGSPCCSYAQPRPASPRPARTPQPPRRARVPGLTGSTTAQGLWSCCTALRPMCSAI